MKRRLSFLTLLLLTMVQCLDLWAGQNSVPWAPEGYNVSFPEGMTSCTNYKVVKDNDGFLWISTSNGVERYDGLSFRHYHLNKERVRTINDGFMVAVVKDEIGDLWTFTERSVITRYNRKEDRFETALSLREKQLMGSIRCLYSTGKELIVGFNNGAVIWDLPGDSLITRLMQDVEIRCLCPYGDRRFLLGTRQGVWCLDQNTRSAQLLCVADTDVNSLYYDPIHQMIWIGSRGEGLCYVYEGRWDRCFSVDQFDNSIINVLTPLNDSVMLVGTDGEGLKACMIRQDRSGDFVVDAPILLASESPQAPCQITNSVIDDILVDGDNLWLTLDLGGFALLQPKSKTAEMVNPIAQSHADHNALDLSIDRNGGFWIAFSHCLVHYPTPEAEPQIHMRDVTNYLTVLAASDGTVWTGGYNAGLYHYNPKTRKYDFYPSVVDQKVLDCVYALCEDTQHDIWVGGLNFGLTCLHYDNTTHTYEHKTYPEVNMITDICTLGKDTIVAATFDGVWLVDIRTGATERLISDENTWKYTNAVSSLIVAGNEIWMGTMGAGLACYNTQTRRAKLFGQDYSIPSLEIRGVEMLNDSVICASTEKNGIFAFDIRNRKIIRTFRHINGQSMGIFARSSSGAAARDLVAFGSDQSVVSVRTDDILAQRDTFSIFVNGANIVNDSIHLDADSRNLDLQVTTNDLYHQSEYRFEYCLHVMSHDLVLDNWEPLDESRRLRYLSMPPGTYEIAVRSFSATSITLPVKIQVEVDQIWYLRWYMVSLYACVFFSFLFFLAHHLRVKAMSETDGLTGIRNRYAGQLHTSTQLEIHTVGVFVLMDCDKFKLVNDNYGHNIGDKLLIRIAHALEATFPDQITMRLGGDEFAFFLTGSYSREKLQAEVDRLIRVVKAIRIIEMGNYEPSISLGAAFYDGRDKITFEQLYTMADRRLYKSKQHVGCWLTME